jgi:uridylate kinase
LYDSDPERNADARFIKTISFMEVLERQLRVMDMTAISLAMDNQLPLMVFNLKEKGNIQKVVCGEDVGTTIRRIIAGEVKSAKMCDLSRGQNAFVNQ